MRTRLTVALIAGLALAGSACSSSGATTATPNSTAAPTTISPAAVKADFIIGGNGICKDMNDKTTALTAAYPGGKPSTNVEKAEMMTKIVDNTDATVVKLRALPQPQADEAKLAVLYIDVDALSALARQMSTALTSGDSATVSSLSAQGDTLSAKANAEANEYGLTECGKTS